MSEKAERAVIYRRVSTADQVDNTSLDWQLAECLTVVEKRGLVLADVWDFVDPARSGKTLDRPELIRLRDDARHAKFEVVVVAKADRLSRDHFDSLTLFKYLETLGIGVVTPDGDLIGRTPEQRLHRNILGVIAEFEREQILRRTKSGLRATAAKGAWPGGPPPYGFRLLRSDSQVEGTRLVIDDAEAAVVRLAVSMLVDEAMTTGEVARELNARGLRPRKAKQWTNISLRRLLLGGAWSGIWVYGHTHHSTASPDEPITVQIPSLLDPERHRALLDALAATSTGRKSRRRPTNYLLSGGRLLGPCGGRFSGVCQEGRDAVYRCANSDGASGPKCGCRRLPADEVERVAWAAVEKTLTNPEDLLSIAQRFLVARPEQVASEEADLAAVRTRIEHLETMLSTQVGQYMAEGIAPSLVKDAVDSIGVEIEALRSRERLLTGRVTESTVQSDRMRALWGLAERAREQLPLLNPVERRVVLDLLGLRVTVLGWEGCGACSGSGKQPGGPGGRRCENCKGMKMVASVMIEGDITDDLIASSVTGNVGDLSDVAGRPSTWCRP